MAKNKVWYYSLAAVRLVHLTSMQNELLVPQHSKDSQKTVGRFENLHSTQDAVLRNAEAKAPIRHLVILQHSSSKTRRCDENAW
jgi:hypothetical protein